MSPLQSPDPPICPACGSNLEQVSLDVTSCRHCGLTISQGNAEAKSKPPDRVRKRSVSNPALPPGAAVLDVSTAAHDIAIPDARADRDVKPPAQGILAVGSLAEAADPAALLADWRQILAPGGVLYLEVPDGLKQGYRLGFTKKSLMLLMERMGFRLIAKERSSGMIAGWFRRY